MGAVAGIATLAGSALFLVRALKVSDFNFETAAIIISSTTITEFLGVLGLEIVRVLPAILALLSGWSFAYALAPRYEFVKKWKIRFWLKVKELRRTQEGTPELPVTVIHTNHMNYPFLSVTAACFVWAIIIRLEVVGGNTAGRWLDYTNAIVAIVLTAIVGYLCATTTFARSDESRYVREAMSQWLPLLLVLFPSMLTPSHHWAPHEVVETESKSIHIQEIGTKNGRIIYLDGGSGAIKSMQDNAILNRYYCSDDGTTSSGSFDAPLCNRINKLHSRLITIEPLG